MKKYCLALMVGILLLQSAPVRAEEMVQWGYQYDGHPVAFTVRQSAVPLLDNSFKANAAGKQSLAEKNYDLALKYFNASLNLRTKAVGADHPLTSSVMNNIGNVYSDQHKAAQAETYYNKAYEIQKKHAKPSSPDYQMITRNLYNSYVALGKTKEAAVS